MPKPQYGFREGNPQSLWQAIKSGKALKMLLKGQIPERFRSWQNIIKYNRKFFFRCIHNTPSLPCEKTAKVSIHSLVCHMDLEMYLVAVKSFLRYYSKVQIVAHSDGSLNKDDKNILRKHIPNISIIDETNKLWQHSLNRLINEFINKGYGNIIMAKLFMHFFTKSKKIIIMDTDIIFLKRPNELIDWIGSENKTLKPLYNIDRYDTLRDAEERLKKEFSITQFCPNFNAGFICMTNNVTKEEIEKMLLINKNYRDTKITKGDQTIYHVMLTRRGAEPLPSRLYNIFNGKTYPNEAKMIHLPTHVRFKKGVYLKLTRKLCRQLKRKNN